MGKNEPKASHSTQDLFIHSGCGHVSLQYFVTSSKLNSGFKIFENRYPSAAHSELDSKWASKGYRNRNGETRKEKIYFKDSAVTLLKRQRTDKRGVITGGELNYQMREHGFLMKITGIGDREPGRNTGRLCVASAVS